MKYIVMECHKSYAVVMDENGSFIKCANFNYEVGDKVEKILPMQEKKEGKILKFALPAVAAACLCFIVAVWSYLYMPFGTVKIEINPQVLVTSNRIDKVIKVEGINEDGKTLIEDYQYKGKEFRTVTEELTEKAESLGYIKSGGDVTITVESSHLDWKLHAEEVLVGNLHIHEGRDFYFVVDGVILSDHMSEDILDRFGDKMDEMLEGADDLDDLDELEDFDDDDLDDDVPAVKDPGTGEKKPDKDFDDDDDEQPAAQAGASAAKADDDDDWDDDRDDEDDDDDDDRDDEGRCSTY